MTPQKKVILKKYEVSSDLDNESSILQATTTTLQRKFTKMLRVVRKIYQKPPDLMTRFNVTTVDAGYTRSVLNIQNYATAM